jgi:hypothetical protein
MRRRWGSGDTIKSGLKGIGWESLDWIDLAQDKDE